MKAMVLHKIDSIENKPLILEECPLPLLEPDELLIKVNVCGVCRTDLHVIEGDIKSKTLPLIPGHQVVGRIVSLGKDCSQFKLNDRIGIAWLRHTCQACFYCLHEKENLCKDSLYTGYHAHGGYAEYAKISEKYAYLIPEEFSDEDAAPLLCAGIVGYRAYKRADLLKGGSLGIYGFGSSAHIIVQIAHYQGAKLFVATRNKTHQALAKNMDAHFVGDGTKPFPELLDSIIIFAPAGNLVPQALQSLKPGGTVCIAGIHMSDIPTMSYNENLFHEKNLHSVEANTREDGHEFLELAKKIPIKPHITCFPLQEANEALIQVKNDAIQGTAVLKLPT